MDEKPTNPDRSNPDQHHLTTSQRALAAARYVEQLVPDAKQRQKAGVRVNGAIKGKATELAAKQFKVGARLVQLALKVLRHGDSKLLERVERGEVSVRRAAELTSLQPRALPSLQRLLDLRAGAYDDADDSDQHVQNWVERLQPNDGQSSQEPASPNWPAESVAFGKRPCPRCPAGPTDDCPLCHGYGYL